MSRKRFLLIFIAASVSAFLGAFASNRLYLSTNAIANDNGKQAANIQSLEKNSPTEFKVVEANQFRLLDMEGKCLAKLTIEEYFKSALDLLKSEQGQEYSKRYRAVLEMGTGATTMKITENNVEIKAGSIQTDLSNDSLTISDIKNGSKQTDPSDKLTIREISRPRIRIIASKDFTTIKLYDKEGNERAALGSVNLNVIATGEVQKRPESSLVLFGKDGKVVYSSP